MLTDDEIDALLKQTQTEGYPSDVRRLVYAVQAAERERWAPVLRKVLVEAEGWLYEARGCEPKEVIGYTGWAERARELLSGPNAEPHGKYQ